MMKKENVINTKISKDVYDEKGSMDLNDSYGQAVAELGLQQSKRDQIIAFYLTILGFVIPSVVSLEVGEGAKAIAFIAMYVIGAIFCHVILRYRIYKEVYWIACRVISQMCNIKEDCRSKEVIYTLFYNALVKNINTIVINGKNGKPSIFKSFKRQINSAETLLFETLCFFATFVGCIGAWYAFHINWILCVIILVYLGYMLIRMNYKYCTRLMALYKCVESQKEKDLEVTFEKAWMLHCYVDDILE